MVSKEGVETIQDFRIVAIRRKFPSEDFRLVQEHRAGISGMENFAHGFFNLWKREIMKIYDDRLCVLSYGIIYSRIESDEEISCISCTLGEDGEVVVDYKVCFPCQSAERCADSGCTRRDPTLYAVSSGLDDEWSILGKRVFEDHELEFCWEVIKLEDT